jgi:hypothetical protein
MLVDALDARQPFVPIRGRSCEAVALLTAPSQKKTSKPTIDSTGSRYPAHGWRAAAQKAALAGPIDARSSRLS